MKNIHILPTDKPSRLVKNGKGLLLVEIPKSYTFFGNTVSANIYITSDEEINQQTESCWCINTIKNTWDADLIYYQGSMPQYHYVGFKKIILTTDQDLIKDGVQTIDDEFLKWFVKNPSCERVEVDDINNKWHKEDGSIVSVSVYKIIIPKEEPKQETLEEAAERKFQNIGDRLIFEDGAKWQQEKSYSVEDMRKAFKVGFSIGYGSDIYAIDEKNRTCEEWFEQFKKK